MIYNCGYPEYKIADKLKIRANIDPGILWQNLVTLLSGILYIEIIHNSFFMLKYNCNSWKVHASLSRAPSIWGLPE